MATVTAAVSLSSAAGDLITDALSLSDSMSVTITGMSATGLGRGKITATSKGASGQVTLYTKGDYTKKFETKPSPLKESKMEKLKEALKDKKNQER